MKALKERILKDGRCLPGGILKVDSFINHQMDPVLMEEMAEELNVTRQTMRRNDFPEPAVVCVVRTFATIGFCAKFKVLGCCVNVIAIV